jgi:hypothetical protein
VDDSANPFERVVGAHDRLIAAADIGRLDGGDDHFAERDYREDLIERAIRTVRAVKG